MVLFDSSSIITRKLPWLKSHWILPLTVMRNNSGLIRPLFRLLQIYTAQRLMEYLGKGITKNSTSLLASFVAFSLPSLMTPIAVIFSFFLNEKSACYFLNLSWAIYLLLQQRLPGTVRVYCAELCSAMFIASFMTSSSTCLILSVAGLSWLFCILSSVYSY